MMVRIIHGKLKPGTWDSYERAYKEVVAKAGKIRGERTLAGTRRRSSRYWVYDQLVGERAATRAYENGEILQNRILPRLEPFFTGDYTTTRCEVRFAKEFD